MCTDCKGTDIKVDNGWWATARAQQEGKVAYRRVMAAEKDRNEWALPDGREKIKLID